MLKRIRNLLRSQQAEEIKFITKAHQYGVDFFSEHMEALRAGSGTPLERHQFVTLRMLVEQGIAAEYDNHFDILSEDIVRLGDSERLLLQLPEPWPGEFKVNFTSKTTHSSFSIHLELIHPSGERITAYTLTGPFLSISEQEVFCLNIAQWLLLDAVSSHSNLPTEARTEKNNLLAVHELQQAKAAGASVDLAQFEKLDVSVPNTVGLFAIQQEDGSLSLLPDFDNNVAAEDIGPRVHQLQAGNHVLRAKDTLVVLSDSSMDAVEEILSNKTIPAHQVQQFLESPGAFLDASKVDLDMGFSIRVKGATTFKPAYFGEKDAAPTDWTGTDGLEGPLPLPLEEAWRYIEHPDSILPLELAITEARSQNAITVAFADNEYILPLNPDQDKQILEHIKRKAQDQMPTTASDTDAPAADDSTTLLTATVDIALEDELQEFETTLDPGKTYLYKENLELTDCIRTPFSYQEAGIRWLLGVATNNGSMKRNTPIVGAILADDMGLGKTFMSLAAAVEYGRLCKQHGATAKPCLVVAPLSLLENWKQEVTKAFRVSPFTEILTLQGQGDLARFKARAGNETRQHEEDIESGLNAIRYVLKVGASWGSGRLDMPGRLILTTYQTLRDYQFSLCRIDWGFVIFDEAQNIKNPNALQTRAAKALKADFILPTTGTPVENSLADFWCLFDTAVPGLLKNYQAFKKEYVTPIIKAGPQEVATVRAQVGTKLRAAVGGLMLRRTKEEELEGLPAKHIFTGTNDPALRAEMSGIQRTLYESILGSAATAADKGDTAGSSGILKALHSLRDVSLHPALLNGGLLVPPSSPAEARAQCNISGKLQLTLSLLDQIQDRKEKVIIFVMRKRLQTYLATALSTIYGLNINIINGDTKAFSKKNTTDTRIGIIRQFEEQAGFNVVIMSPVAAGVGLTVVGANNVIHLERHWNPAKEAQATDRVYRIGATRDVNVYIPLLTHPEITSFDVHLDHLLSRKLDLKDAVITPVEISCHDLVTSGVLKPTIHNTDGSVTARDLRTLSWKNFEALTALALERKLGGESMLTPHPTDWGADVVIKTATENILVQCKHLSSSDSLRGDGAIREVYGAKPKYEEILNDSVHRLIVTTNAKQFSPETQKAARRYNVELWGYHEIKAILEQEQIGYDKVIRKESSERFPK